MDSEFLSGERVPFDFFFLFLSSYLILCQENSSEFLASVIFRLRWVREALPLDSVSRGDGGAINKV